MGFNTITVMGKVVKDPEYKNLENNGDVASFSVHYGEKKDDKFINYYFQVSVYGTQCAVAMKYLKKGFRVTVSGSLKISEYIDKEGAQRTSFEIKNPQIHLMDNREVSDQPNQSQQTQPKESAVKVLATNGQPANPNGAGQRQYSRPSSQNNGRSNAQYPPRKY